LREGVLTGTTMKARNSCWMRVVLLGACIVENQSSNKSLDRFGILCSMKDKLVECR
jgi:hypothetical protein